MGDVIDSTLMHINKGNAHGPQRERKYPVKFAEAWLLFCKVTGILLMNGIPNLSSTDKELEIQSLETGRESMTDLDALTRGNKYNHL